MMKTVLLASMLAASGGLAGCEKAGENIDSAIEKADGGPKDPGDGPMEKAGERIDNVIGVERKDGADSLADALDNDKATKPD